MSSKPPLAELIAVGTELLGEARAETDSLLIAGYLAQLGIEVRRKVVVGDDEQLLREAFEQALAGVPLIFLTGGLGPTADDITREVVASVLHRALLVHQPSLKRLEAIYRRLKLEIKENSLRQVRVPEGAEVLDNDHGTAPGLLLKENGRQIYLLPGPPRELAPMMQTQVMPRLKASWGLAPVPFRRLRLASLAESAVDARIEPFLKRFPDIRYTILSNPGLIEVMLRSPDSSAAAVKRLDSLHAAICSEFGPDLYSTQSEEITAVIGTILRDQGWSLATAESCTGGFISKLLTDLAGSSEFYLGGVIAYSNRIKQEVLGVSPATLERFGAVSSQTAEEMAVGVCRLTGARTAVSVTGIAGPTGGNQEKPVGTVWFGSSVDGRVSSKHRRFPGDRNSIRLRAAHFGLDWLRRKLST